jgi:hypothetical protein
MIVIQQQLQRGKLYCNQNENFQHFFFIKTALYSATVLTATAIFIEAINVYTLTKDK